MRKLVLVVLLVIMIPYTIVTLFIADDEIHFEFKKEQKIKVKQSSGNIITLPFEEYITGVLAGEMPVQFEKEALKAQAVAARSYALVRIMQNKGKEYDVVDTVSNQVYLDENTLKEKWKETYTEKMNKIRNAIFETKSEYLDYNGQIVEAFFFSTSTGKTENVEEVFSEKLPYLRSVDSSFDAEVSPVFESSVSYTLDEFYKKLSIPVSNDLNIQVVQTTSTGRIKKIVINQREFTGSDVAYKLNLRSSYFSIFRDGNKVVIHTKGYGHGVGMSQYGAEALAKKGYTYDQILKHYYTNVEIKKLKKSV